MTVTLISAIILIIGIIGICDSIKMPNISDEWSILPEKVKVRYRKEAASIYQDTFGMSDIDFMDKDLVENRVIEEIACSLYESGR